MAKIDNKGNLRGVIGNISTRVLHGKNIIQQKSAKQKQSENTKKAAKAFGYASLYSKPIRLALCAIIGKNHDRELFRRFTSATYKLLKNNTEIPVEARTFFNTNMQGLLGFDLNNHSPFADSCTLPLQIETREGHNVVLTINSFAAQDYFVFPENTSTIRLDFTLISIHFPHSEPVNSTTFSLHFSKEEIVSPQVWETSLLLPPHFTLMLAEVNYIQRVNDHKVRCINNDKFHPTAIVYIHNGII